MALLFPFLKFLNRALFYLNNSLAKLFFNFCNMRFSLGAIAFVFCSMIHSSLAEFPFDGDFLSPEPYPGDSNLYLDSDWQVPEDSTLVFNDVLYPADSDLDFLAASTCGNGNGNLNKLRARDETFCFNGGQRKKEGAIVPQVIQPGEKLFDQLDQLGSTTKSGSEKCVFPPYLTNLCCNGFLGDIYLLGPPSVWTSIDDCYSSMTFNLLLAAAMLGYELLDKFDRLR